MDVTVCYSWSGVAVVYNCQPEATVQNLQEFIARQTTIPPPDQIILYGPPFKNADHRVAMAKLEGKSVFVYDRTSLSRSAAHNLAIPPIILSPMEVDLPSSESLPHSHNSLREFAESGDPLLRALADYERTFFHHVLIAEVYQSTGKSRLDASVNCLNEQQRILKAIQAAQGSLQDNDSSLSAAFDNLWGHVCSSHEKHEQIMHNFEDSLNQTALVHIDPELQQGGRMTLFDWLPVDRLRQRCHQCANYEHRLWKKAYDLRHRFEETTSAVSSELNHVFPEIDTSQTTGSPTAAQHLLPIFASDAEAEAEKQRALDLCDNQRAIVEKIGADYRRVLDEVLSAQQMHKEQQDAQQDNVMQSTLQMCRAYDELRKTHSNTLLVR